MKLKYLVLIFLCGNLFSQPLQSQNNWRLAKTKLATEWTQKVRPDNVLPEYPRPQMTRNDWMNLNGAWSFVLMDKATEAIVTEGKILVPFPVESALSGIRHKVEPGHLMIYNRSFAVPEDWDGQRTLLHFGAVDYHTTVYLNTKKVGEHTGGYDPFTFDLTDYLKPGEEQQLTVQVTDPTDTGGQAIGKQRLSPSGIWYTPTSGIWQSVWLEPVPKTYISSYRVEPDIDKKRILVRVNTEGTNKQSVVVTAKILQNGRRVSEAKGKAGTPLLLNIRKDMRLWSPEDPHLYDLEISLDNPKKKDLINGYFGMRKISLGKDEQGNTCMQLNNQPRFQIGVLDQGYFPDGLYTPPTEEAMINDLQSMKNMGFNMIRKHVKIEPARWYHLCDKMGLMVWQDMPSAANESKEDQQQFKYELKAMVDHLFNFPSILMWVPFNEAWGQHETEDYVEKLKKWDPTRLVNNASGWTDSGTGDVHDIHSYPGPASTKKETDRAIALGEFGGLALKVRGHHWSKTSWGYQDYETPEELLHAYEELWWKLHELQDTAGLSAVVYTQLSDIETENNGLLTYDRKVTKIEPTLVAAIHKGILPPRPVGEARIFVKKANIELKAVSKDADIQYTLDGHASDAKWFTYSEPIKLKKTGIVRCRSSWPDGTKSHAQSYHFTKTKPIKSSADKAASTEIQLSLYEGVFETLPDFGQLQPVSTKVVSEISLAAVDRAQHFAAVFETHVEIPETGVYTFEVTSDDGSRLMIGNQVIIDNDGIHGMVPGSASIALKKGMHPLRLEFFQKEGGKGLKLKW